MRKTVSYRFWEADCTDYGDGHSWSNDPELPQEGPDWLTDSWARLAPRAADNRRHTLARCLTVAGHCV